MKKRVYLDYNSTSPLAASVLQMLAKGLVHYGNSASVHSSGKMALRQINEVRSFLFKIFSLDHSSYDLVFHSGTTEFVNSLTKGLALQNHFNDSKFNFLYLLSDHPCVLEQKLFLESLDQKFRGFDCDKDGQFPSTDIKNFFNQVTNDDGYKPNQNLLNFTWVNNVTGITFDLKEAVEIKNISNCLIHVDATQAVGKIKGWQNLDNRIDIYTFSGHKFGSLKGIGFSFVKKELFLNPLLDGGAQQPLRSGTLNNEGIVSVKLALEEMIAEQKDFSVEKTMFEQILKEYFNDEIEIIGENSRRNFNTSCLLFKNKSVQDLFIKLDMNGYDISFGSACKSGIPKANSTMLAMNYSEKDAQNILRISFPIKTIDFDLKKEILLLTDIIKK